MHRLRSIACGKRVRTMGLTLLTGILATAMASATGRPNGMIKDCPYDVGAEPNYNCGDFYRSPDITVRNTQGFVPVHQQPITGQPNWVYVTVTNIGTSTLTDGVVHLYFAKASTGLFWSSSWINDIIGGITYGDEIGFASVPALAPNTSANVEIQWNTVPNPANFNDPDARHFCLLARLESPSDPMTFTEGTSLQPNVQNNNNIAWKNISVMDPVHPTGAVDIQANGDANTELHFGTPKDQQDRNPLDHVGIKVDLGDELFQIWQANGQQGEGITIDEENANTVNIDQDGATITGLPLTPGTRYTLHVNIIYPGEFDPDLAGQTFQWDIQQFNEGETDPVGGEGYDINLPSNERPDIMIKDCLADVGNEPNTDCYAFYASPSIWVRNNPDGLPGHQQPITGVPNYIYVKITNIGGATLNTGDLHVYFAKASTGLTWTTSWINNLLPSCLGGGTTLYGAEIGAQTVTNVLPGETRDIAFTWNNVPDPNDFCDPDARHFCLLARFVSAEDPMASPEGIYIQPNVQNNNNIAWKNVSIMDATHTRGSVDVRKDPSIAGTTKLQFDVPEGEEVPPVHDGGIRVELGAALHDLWAASGQRGEGVTDVGDDNGTIIVNDPHAWIGGLTLADDVRYTLHVEVVYPDEVDPALAGTTFHWDITQVNEQDGTIAGGERYDIVMPGDAGKRMLSNGKADLTSTLKMVAHPNPTSSGTTIGFTLPSADRISVAIYDANGRLVRQLLQSADRPAGNQQMVWNGQSSNGRRVPSGTYICRISTSAGAAEQQIKVMR